MFYNGSERKVNMETTPSTLSWLVYLQIIGPIFIGLVGVLLAFYTSVMAIKNKQHDDERAEIYKKLNEFYSPFEQLRKKSFRLYQLFTEGKDDSFRTLPALLRGDKFSENNQKLLEEIIRIDEKLEKLILDKSGLIDQGEIRDLLAKAATHFHIITQAFNGQLHGEPDRFNNYVFPRELDGKISEQINTLKERLNKLNR